MKTFKEIRQESGMNLTQFSEHFNIPYRTLQHWEHGTRQCPGYVLNMLERIIELENRITKTKIYKVEDIVKVLTEYQEIGIDGYCGFEINDKGNLVVILKDHEPDYPEAVEEVELLQNEGEY